MIGGYMSSLKERILESGYTQNHIARQIGCHFTEVSQWVAGRRVPNRDRKKALARILKCKMSDFDWGCDG